MDRDDVTMWLFYDNVKPGKFCGRDDVIKASGDSSRVITSVMTKDFLIQREYIMQYEVSKM